MTGANSCGPACGCRHEAEEVFLPRQTQVVSREDHQIIINLGVLPRGMHDPDRFCQVIAAYLGAGCENLFPLVADYINERRQLDQQPSFLEKGLVVAVAP